jgi:hypothetical protein
MANVSKAANLAYRPIDRRSFVALVTLSLSSGPGLLRAEPSQTVEIVTKAGIRVITVELAAGDEQVKKGLSGRKELPSGSGMLLDFRSEVEAAMGTKDMLLALDMIFIRADGQIRRIAENVEPQSSRQIFSEGPVRAVLEVPAGTCRLLGIAAGDRVAHLIFRRGR